MTITDAHWRAFGSTTMIWARRWCRRAKPGPTAGVAPWGRTRPKKPLQGRHDWACLRRTKPNCHVISANGTVRVMTRRDNAGVLVRRAADGAAGLACDTHFRELHGAAIEHQQAPGEGAADGAEQLERFSRLQGADDAHQRCKNTHRGAACFFKGVIRGEDTGVAGRVGVARVIDTNLAIKADGRARYQRFAVFHTG